MRTKIKYPKIYALLTPMILALVVSSAYLAVSQTSASNPADPNPVGGNWRFWGHDLHNSHFAQSEHKINPSNAGDLKIKWVYEVDKQGVAGSPNPGAGNSVSATPSVFGGAVYFPDWAGRFHSVDAETGLVNWVKDLPADYGTGPLTLSRVTPAVYGDVIYIGDRGREPPWLNLHTFDGADVLGINRITGDLVWKTRVDDGPQAMTTASFVVHDGVLYGGVSSREEVLPGNIPNYPCCDFVGSVYALDAQTGEMLWKTPMIDPSLPTGPGEWSGIAVWGSQFPIDLKRRQIYVGTSNNYEVPESVKACFRLADCVDENGDPLPGCVKDPEGGHGCVPEGVHVDSILALDLDTGAINWSKRLTARDVWNLSCGFPNRDDGPPKLPICPDLESEDVDFGQAPMLVTTVDKDTGLPRELVVAGQKNGLVWALDPDKGNVVWGTQTGPAGQFGGHEWGSATDGEKIYVQDSNSNLVQWTLISGQITTAGFWSALDASTGDILWQTADPEEFPQPSPSFCDKRAEPIGAVSVANGVLYGGTACGGMFGLDTETGEVLWEFRTNNSGDGAIAVAGVRSPSDTSPRKSGPAVFSAPSIDNGVLYWGSGYSAGAPARTNLGFNPRDNKVYAFDLESNSNALAAKAKAPGSNR